MLFVAAITLTHLITSTNGLGINECHISTYNNCSLSSLTPNERTIIFPGGDTRCIGNSSDASFDGKFGFMVTPGVNGNTNDVLFNLADGGACWDQISSAAHLCNQQVLIPKLVGIYDRVFKGNPFKDWLLVDVPYCGGDAHVGYFSEHADWDTKFEDSEYGVVQNGAVNVQSALDWLIDNIEKTPGNLVVSGGSAGALGVQVWAHPIKVQLDAIDNNCFPSRAVFIIDSYVGFFPPGIQGKFVRDTWNLCENPLVMKYYSDDVMQKCRAGILEAFDFVKEAASYHSNVPFAFIQSKVDSTQETFYSSIAITETNMSLQDDFLTECEFFNGVNSILQQYTDYPNIVTYFINSKQHMYLTYERLYTSDAAGTKTTAFEPNLITWISLLNSYASTECVGDVRNAKDCDPELNVTFRYCHEDLVGKKFYVHTPKGECDDFDNNDNDDDDDKSSMLFTWTMICISIVVIPPIVFYFVQLIRKRNNKSSSSAAEEEAVVFDGNSDLTTSLLNNGVST